MTASLTKDGSRYALRFERQLPHPPAKVWRVLTERELLRQWFPTDIVGEWVEGAKLEFPMEGLTAKGATEEDYHGKVLAADRPRLLEYLWGRHLLRFELDPEGDGCRLTFVHTFDEASTAARNAAGWEMCFANMDAVLTGEPAEDFDMEAWEVLFDRYVSEFEPRAGAQQGAPSEE